MDLCSAQLLETIKPQAILVSLSLPHLPPLFDLAEDLEAVDYSEPGQYDVQWSEADSVTTAGHWSTGDADETAGGDADRTEAPDDPYDGKDRSRCLLSLMCYPCVRCIAVLQALLYQSTTGSIICEIIVVDFLPFIDIDIQANKLFIFSHRHVDY